MDCIWIDYGMITVFFYSLEMGFTLNMDLFFWLLVMKKLNILFYLIVFLFAFKILKYFYIDFVYNLQFMLKIYFINK